MYIYENWMEELNFDEEQNILTIFGMKVTKSMILALGVGLIPLTIGYVFDYLRELD